MNIQGPVDCLVAAKMIRNAVTALGTLGAVVLACGTVNAEQFIESKNVLSDVHLQLTDPNAVSCGVDVHYLTYDEREHATLDYHVNFETVAGVTDGKAHAMVFMSGSVFKVLVEFVNGQVVRQGTKQINPFDMFVTVPGVASTMHLRQMSSDLMSNKPFVGYPVGADGVTLNDAAYSIMLAVISQQPILVSMVMENSPDGTKTLRVVDNPSVPM